MLIEIPRTDLELDLPGGVRSFYLEQQSWKSSAKFFLELDRAAFRELETRTSNADLEVLTEQVANEMGALLAGLLHPSDGNAGLLPCEVAELRPEQWSCILQEQLKLDRLDELAPRVIETVYAIQAQRLLRAVERTQAEIARRVAEQASIE